MIKKTVQKSGLELAIDKLISELSETDCSTDEYSTMLRSLERLYALREKDAKRRVSPETIAAVVGNLAGILLILHYERAHVVTSKALSFVMKLR